MHRRCCGDHSGQSNNDEYLSNTTRFWIHFFMEPQRDMPAKKLKTPRKNLFLHYLYPKPYTSVERFQNLYVNRGWRKYVYLLALELLTSVAKIIFLNF